ncbi:MAG TPA: hypothetical protein ENH34_02280 [Phycisphaerales bacterium]|nr:hypothetical protein [Phycisphaerales bacterium]
MKRLLASCFGLGRLPIAPGTWGSLPPAIVFVLLCYLGLSAGSISIVMAGLALVGSVVCVKFAPAAIAATGCYALSVMPASSNERFSKSDRFSVDAQCLRYSKSSLSS